MVAGSVTCGRCGVVAPPTARFCAVCGGPLAVGSPVEVRKTVTALFCDVSGSTALVAQLDPEALRALMERYFAVASALLSRHGGTVEKFVGDAVMASFGVPVAHEDDALRACRAAAEILDAVRQVDVHVSAEHGAVFAVRIGVETGEVLVGDPARGSTFVSGAAVNMAARLEQVAGQGECLIGPACYRLVRAHVQVEPRQGLLLKGIDGSTEAMRLIAVHDVAAVVRPLSGRLVGRSRELALLRQAFDRAVGDRTCQLATVLGVAGMGKSRVAQELLSELSGQARVLRGRCLSYGDGVTWWPLVEIVRDAAALTGAESQLEACDKVRALLGGAPDSGQVVERVAAVAGLGGDPGPPEDTAWAVRRLLEELARTTPLVMVVDDLHWAETGLLAVVEDITEWLQDVPVLVLVLARPEFLDDHPTWAGGRINAVTAMLEPLATPDVATLTSDLLGGTPPPETLSRVRELAGGNPLYLEHLLAMLQEDGVLGPAEVRVNGEGFAELRVPPTITALISARLDRLTAEERATLATASVMGQVFYRGAVAELADIEAVPSQLSSLVRKGLVRPTASDVPGQEALAFSHLLVRESAYGGLPKAVRAELHERFARWLDRNTEGQAYDDLVGDHLESAYLLVAELGRPNAAARELGLEASRRLQAAAAQLRVVDDMRAAALLERADRLRADSGPERWALRLELARVFLNFTIRLTDVVAVCLQVLEEADAAGEPAWALRARLLLAMERQHTAPEGATEALRTVTVEALAFFEPRGDNEGLLIVHEALANVSQMDAQMAANQVHLQRAADYAERAGRPREAAVLRQVATMRAIWGDLPASAGLAGARRNLERSSFRADRAQATSTLAHLSGLLGDAAASADAWAETEALGVELRGPFPRFFIYGKARYALATCDWVGADGLLERTAADLEEIGDLSVLSTELAYRAHTQLHLGDVIAARALAARALEVGSSDDVLTLGLAYSAQGWIAALDRDAAAAAELATKALTTLPADLLNDRAMVHLTAAEADLALGDPVGAATHRRAALELFHRKENVVAETHVQHLLDGSGQ